MGKNTTFNPLNCFAYPNEGLFRVIMTNGLLERVDGGGLRDGFASYLEMNWRSLAKAWMVFNPLTVAAT